jgi:hypothetical protein
MATREQCQRALDRYEQELAGRPNVVGLGISPHVDESGNQGEAVTVYVTRKVPLSELAEDDRVPPHLEVAGRGGTIEVPTKVVEQGPVEKEALGG